MTIIDRFQGEYEFLSNFYPAEVVYNNRSFRTVEHAYQAAKTLDAGSMFAIQVATYPGDAKRLGRMVPLRQDWESVKVGVMELLLERKFADPSLSEKLISTYPSQLVEGNTWGDEFWGVDVKTKLGQNRLGRLLMILRDGLIADQAPVRNLDSF